MALWTVDEVAFLCAGSKEWLPSERDDKSPGRNDQKQNQPRFCFPASFEYDLIEEYRRFPGPGSSLSL